MGEESLHTGAERCCKHKEWWNTSGWDSSDKPEYKENLYLTQESKAVLGDYNCFPHIPSKTIKRKEKIEEILKEVQELIKQLRYQVRMGETDVKVMVKYFYKNDYRP